MKSGLLEYLMSIPDVCMLNHGPIAGVRELNLPGGASVPLLTYGWEGVVNRWSFMEPEDLPRFLCEPTGPYTDPFRDALRYAAQHWLEHHTP